MSRSFFLERTGWLLGKSQLSLLHFLVTRVFSFLRLSFLFLLFYFLESVHSQHEFEEQGLANLVYSSLLLHLISNYNTTTFVRFVCLLCTRVFSCGLDLAKKLSRTEMRMRKSLSSHGQSLSHVLVSEILPTLDSLQKTGYKLVFKQQKD
jgi:hypothetical protein